MGSYRGYIGSYKGHKLGQRVWGVGFGVVL